MQRSETVIAEADSTALKRTHDCINLQHDNGYDSVHF